MAGRQSAWQRVQEETAWMWPLLKFLFGSASFLVWYAAIWQWLPDMCASREQFWKTLRHVTRLPFQHLCLSISAISCLSITATSCSLPQCSATMSSPVLASFTGNCTVCSVLPCIVCAALLALQLLVTGFVWSAAESPCWQQRCSDTVVASPV